MTPAEIKALRWDMGLSVEGLARALAVDSRTLRRWEEGTREVSKPVLRLLALAQRHAAVRRELQAWGAPLPMGRPKTAA